MVTKAQPKPFKWVGGHLSLDFNNTVDWDEAAPGGGEYLTDYGRLVSWGYGASLLSERVRDQLLAMWDRKPSLGERTLAMAWSVRSTIHRVFFGIITGTLGIEGELGQINALLRQAPGQLQYKSSQRACGWVWPACDSDPACMIWPVVWSASQLLTSSQLANVKTCANENCGWLFLDTSRKHNRKWCEMGVCGNRAKARRYYKRRKQRSQGG